MTESPIISLICSIEFCFLSFGSSTYLMSACALFFAMNDTLAFAAIEVIKEHRLRIPEDIAIIGYTDEQHANYVEPKLSAVSHQTYKMGETACQLLIDQIKGDKTVRQVIIPTNLQIRESSRKK